MFAYREAKRICIRNELGFTEVASLFSETPDVILKLTDGVISTHKGLLASASPVFKTMFFGNFKEANKKEVTLPTDTYKTIQRLIDIISKGSCELDDLDDTIPLKEVFERCQINSALFLHMCGPAILSQMDSSNYLTLLPKYYSVMNAEGHKKAADKVMSYTKNDFNLLPSLIRPKIFQEIVSTKRNDIACHEVEIFNYPVKWHDYQTEKSVCVFRLARQLFRCVRYSMIIPQLLSSVVAKCPLVDTSALVKAFEYMYSSCKPIGEIDFSTEQCFNQCLRKPSYSSKVDWYVQQAVTIGCSEIDKCNITFLYKKTTKR